MPASYDDFALPGDAKVGANKQPNEMIDAAFRALGDWFAGLIPKIEAEYQRGMSDKVDKMATQIRLGKIMGEFSGMKDVLLQYINTELKANPAIKLDDYKLPIEATIKGNVSAPVMMGKAFQALKPWFDCLVKIIRPVYGKLAAAPGVTPQYTSIKLKGLQGTVNVMKSLLLNYVNEEQRKQDAGQKYNALASGDEEAEIPEGTVLTVLEEILDVEIGDNTLPEADDGVTVDISEDLQD